jgi:hypothetical protein
MDRDPPPEWFDPEAFEHLRRAFADGDLEAVVSWIGSARTPPAGNDA